LSPLFFEGPNSESEQNPDESDDYIYNRLGRELDRKHVESGNYEERAVDAHFNATRVSFKRKNSKSICNPKRISTPISEKSLERGM
jgi:hypothetical protein